MKIASFNINGIKARLLLLREWLEREKPDVIGLQELKADNDKLEQNMFADLGYSFIYNGQKSYNGVAILSKEPINKVQKGFRNGYDPENARLIAATISGVKLINVYVPQGQTTESDKFKYKLEFLQELKQEIAHLKDSKNPLQ